MVRRLTEEQAKANIRKVHGDYYDLSQFVYVNAITKGTIICPVHGPIEMRYSDLHDGAGCKYCGHRKIAKNNSKSCEDYIKDAIKIHGDSYDYSLVDKSLYGGNTKVNIKCNMCGEIFSQSLSNHARGCGCSKCQDYGFSEVKKGYLYLLQNSDMIKIGITNRPVSQRLAEINKGIGDKFRIVRHFLTDGHVCKEAERQLHKIFSESLQNPRDTFHGYTESFVTEYPDVYIQLFDHYTLDLPKSGETIYRKRPDRKKETPEERRARLSLKTGRQVGVTYREGKWKFSIMVKRNGKKDKKFLGSFNEFQDCEEFAKYYWETKTVQDTTKNLMRYNCYGLPKCVVPHNGKFKVSGGFGVSRATENHYLGQYNTVDEAILAISVHKLLNGGLNE